MLLDDVADTLSTGALGPIGTTADWTITKGAFDVEPDRAVSIFEYGGMPSIHAMAAGPGLAVKERPRFQVMVRAPEGFYSTGRQKAQDAFRLLDGLRDRTINGVRYDWITAVQPPFYVGLDEARRPLFACNYEVVKAVSTA